MHPREIADASERLRQGSVELLDSLSEEEYQALALPPRHTGGEGWTVADVFRHLAVVDRRSALGAHLAEFLPGRTEDDFEDANDALLERLRSSSRQELRDELITWGRRLQRIVRWTPAVVARRTVPTMFGRVSLAWLAMLRVYDEWVHQDDVRRALHRDEVPPDAETRTLLAEFQLRALPAKPLRSAAAGEGVVEVAFDDVLAQPAWRFDLARRQFGPRVSAEPDAHVHTDVGTWCRIAANRIAWRDAESAGTLHVDGADRAPAEALLDVVRVV
jgi:hypothetical protein